MNDLSQPFVRLRRQRMPLMEGMCSSGVADAPECGVDLRGLRGCWSLGGALLGPRGSRGA